MNMKPEEWQNLTLSDLATVVGGGTPSRTVPNYWTGYLPWATPTDITGLSGRFISETKSTIANAGLASSSATLLPPYSLLLTTRATIGACAINRVPMATNQGFQNLVPKQDVDIDFLYYLVRHHSRGLERLAAGSTFLEVSKSAVRGFQVTVPPLAEQSKIAAILSSVDDAIEKAQVVIEQVQVVKRGLMSELLTRGQRGGICATKRRTKVGHVSENWEAVTLGDIATVVGGGTPSRSHSNYWNGDIPWATPTDVTGLSGRVISKTASTITNSGLANSSATLLPPNSLLVTTRATIGACAISRISMATNQGFQNLVPKMGVCVEFLYYLIQHHTRNLERLGAGSTYLEIPKRVFSRFAVYLPPLTEQRRIVAILSSLDDAIQFELEAADRYKVVKRSLMSVLLTGELHVTPDPEAA